MEPKVKLEVSVQMLNVIMTGLAKLPLEVSMETFHFVRTEAEKQLGQTNGTPTTQAPMANKVMN